MIAISNEKYMAKYHQVEIDQPEGEVTPNNNTGTGNILTERGSMPFNNLINS